ncbi:hypothetical protein G9A89_010854 [Geosiphon pyriformis]|nr:hypothetical protein G9A89_010854 [Geosiphon pyriformis]
MAIDEIKNLNLENPEIETPNFRMQHDQNDQNPDINNQQYLPPVIMINLIPAPLIDKQQQQLLQSPQLPQQPLPQPQQQLQQPNLNPKAYAPIAKLEKFTSKEDNTQVWLNDVEKAIESANYFTVAQILNQFICRLHSSILQHVHPIHPVNLQAAVTNARDFETAELEANHVQAVNLVMNRSSELDSKLKQFTIGTIHLSATVYQPIPSSSTQPAGSRQWNSDTGYAQNPNSQNYLSLLVTPKNAQPNNLETKQQSTLTSNIPPTTITENETLNTIFPFKLEETTPVLLFSGATLNTKPITAMYTDVKVNGHFIKLILDSRSAGSIITKQLIDQLGCQVDHTASTRIITTNGATKTLIGEIDDFPFEVNGIIIPIKVLVIEATQYQALIENDCQHTCVPATCGHLKPTNLTAPLIKFEEEEKKPTWKAYQVFWADTEHNELPPVLLWNDNSKKKQKDKKGKGKRKEEEPTTDSKPTYNSYTTPHQFTYYHPKLVCIDCNKKLSSMGACCSDNKEYTLATKFYCRPCIIECFRRPKWVGKWDNKLCLTCEKTFLDKGM